MAVSATVPMVLRGAARGGLLRALGPARRVGRPARPGHSAVRGRPPAPRRCGARRCRRGNGRRHGRRQWPQRRGDGGARGAAARAGRRADRGDRDRRLGHPRRPARRGSAAQLRGLDGADRARSRPGSARPGPRLWCWSPPSSAGPRRRTAPAAPTMAPARRRCCSAARSHGGRVIADWPGLAQAPASRGPRPPADARPRRADRQRDGAAFRARFRPSGAGPVPEQRRVAGRRGVDPDRLKPRLAPSGKCDQTVWCR